ncbi:hypothetical protein WJX75_004277 [Coccomyxa subellipsoidea]|uniref:GAF domain-containing protein n=1 Tax=Coccomyxa subellipsoidea TaxID=248742 RepID=A0ABR2YCX4_9CHLO
MHPGNTYFQNLYVGYSFDYFHWTGFYRTFQQKGAPSLYMNTGKKRYEQTWLKIGPYQGKHGCLRIPAGKGVCGQALAEERTLNVPDVHTHPGHIACASSTQSEIVIPVWANDRSVVIGVLDVDSDIKAAFTAEDTEGLEAICRLLSDCSFDTASIPILE